MAHASHAAALSIAKRNAFRAYESAVHRKRDTVRIVWALVGLFIASCGWEWYSTGSMLGPHWLILLFIGAGFRAIKFSDTQLELARANLVAVSEMYDALSVHMGTMLERVDEHLTAIDKETLG